MSKGMNSKRSQSSRALPNDTIVTAQHKEQPVTVSTNQESINTESNNSKIDHDNETELQSECESKQFIQR